MRQNSAFPDLALLEKGTSYITVHVTLRPETEPLALRNYPMPKMPYHRNGLRGSTVGVVVLLLNSIQVRLFHHNWWNCALTAPKSAQYEDEKTNSGVVRGDNATGKSQESTSPEPQFHSPVGLAK